MRYTKSRQLVEPRRGEMWLEIEVEHKGRNGGMEGSQNSGRKRQEIVKRSTEPEKRDMA